MLERRSYLGATAVTLSRHRELCSWDELLYHTQTIISLPRRVVCAAYHCRIINNCVWWKGRCAAAKYMKPLHPNIHEMLRMVSKCACS